MKPRHHIYLDRELTSQLDALAKKPGTSKSAIVSDALRSHFRRRGMREVDDLLKVRLDRIGADQRRVARDMEVLLESLSLFLHHQFSLTAQIPEPDVAARAVGRDRFQKFIDQVGRQIAGKPAAGEPIVAAEPEGAVS
jgi:predicted transcriptional regulator